MGSILSSLVVEKNGSVTRRRQRGVCVCVCVCVCVGGVFARVHTERGGVTEWWRERERQRERKEVLIQSIVQWIIYVPRKGLCFRKLSDTS